MTPDEAIIVLREMAASIRLDVACLSVGRMSAVERDDYLRNAEACERGSDALDETMRARKGMAK